MDHAVVGEQVGYSDGGILHRDGAIGNRHHDRFPAVAGERLVVEELVARQGRLDDVPAQDFVPIGGVEEVVHIVESIFLGEGEDGAVGGGEDREVAGCGFVVVDDGLADEVVVEQVGVDLLLEQRVVRAVHHDLVHGRLRGSGGSHAVIDDVHDAVVGHEIGGDDVGPVDGQSVRILPHHGAFPVQGGQDHARFEVRSEVGVLDEVVLQDVGQIRDVEHVK